MVLLNVIKAKYLNDYKVQLSFNNGETKTVDLKGMVFQDKRAIFKPLREVEYFKRFEVKLNTISWPNELDPAPEFLYKLATEQEKRPQTLAKNP